MGSTAFIINSMIHLPDGPLSYSDVRSVYGPEERAEQTVETIESIRRRMPEAKVVLVESGLEPELPGGLESMADVYLYVGGKRLVAAACSSKYKGLGEAVSLLSASANYPDCDTYFKLSGRYALNDDFSTAGWEGRGFVFRKYGRSVSTRLYKFGRADMWAWKGALLFGIPSLMRNRSMEAVMHRLIPKGCVTYRDLLGVRGLIGPNGHQIIE